MTAVDKNEISAVQLATYRYMPVAMPTRLTAHASRQYGMFRRADALESGFDDNDILRLLRAGRWRRLRRGRYVETELWQRLDTRQRLELTTRAVLSRMRPPIAASHWTAASILGLTIYRPEADMIQVTRASLRHPKVGDGVRQHAARLDPADVVQVRGLPVTIPARTVLDIARYAHFDSALVTADSAMRCGLERRELEKELAAQRFWPGCKQAYDLVQEADGRAESPGESLCRYVFRIIGLPRPELQWTIQGQDSGRQLARCDFAWKQYRTVGEFDGKLKYQRGQHEEPPGDVVFREKKREEWIRNTTGFLMVRLTSEDLHPDRYAEVYERAVRIFRDAARINGLPTPNLPERYPGRDPRHPGNPGRASRPSWA